MDCGTFSNLFSRFACIMNNTRVDEYFGFGVLVVIGVGGSPFWSIRSLSTGT